MRSVLRAALELIVIRRREAPKGAFWRLLVRRILQLSSHVFIQQLCTSLTHSHLSDEDRVALMLQCHLRRFRFVILMCCVRGVYNVGHRSTKWIITHCEYKEEYSILTVRWGCIDHHASHCHRNSTIIAPVQIKHHWHWLPLDFISCSCIERKCSKWFSFCLFALENNFLAAARIC